MIAATGTARSGVASPLIPTPGRPGEHPALVLKGGGGLGGGLEQGGLPGDAYDQLRVEAPDAEGGLASRGRRGAGDGTAHGAEACWTFSS